MRGLLRSVIVVAALDVLLSVRQANACSAPACRESYAAPRDARTVPSNAPAIVFVQGTTPFFGPKTPPAPPVLRTESGATIGHVRDGDFLRPSSALPVGNVVLEWDETCVSSPDAGVSRKSTSFQVVPASSLPSVLGTVSFAHAVESITVVTNSGSCTDKIDAATARMSFALDAKLAPFRDVLRIATRVDGAAWASTAWGRDGPTTYVHPYGLHLGARRHDLVFAACGTPPTGVDRGLAEGKHAVEIRAEVAGAAPLPAVTFEIDLRCGGAVDGGSVGSDGGGVGIDGGSTGTGPIDGGVVDAGGAPAKPSDPDGSCSCAMPGRETRASQWTLLALIVLTRRARRRMRMRS